ncbi:hypothetical protein HELRODRAFT_188177 [Helobdella robusta]|uniref:Uncharacterized protein n=1 Tax=Helobdella robusta TaxID=6412 RepID=T1FPQ8_HELRO|nr:hypothetical protein HELRODRAFT_188177 [Helobdella robusta]ESO13235.1 hypothetical protein HELRODRAFT_188177 [Helobdella robusta]
MSKRDLFAGSGDQLNWLLHLNFVRKDYDKCRNLLRVDHERQCQNEYGSYVLGLVARIDGDINESLKHFQTASAINCKNVANFKQIAKSLFLLARHKAALDVYSEAEKLCHNDWELTHNKALCYMYLKDLNKAKEVLNEAIQYKDSHLSHSLLGEIYQSEMNINKSIAAYTKALAVFPENVDISCTLGLLYLQMGDYKNAFSHLGNAMTYDPDNVKAIMGAGSMLQMHGDHDVALAKYKLAVRYIPNSGPLWNNIGMCYFNKKKLVAAVSCLKRAHYFCPLERTISQNLVLIYLYSQQYASAFNFITSAMFLRFKSALHYFLLAVLYELIKMADKLHHYRYIVLTKQIRTVTLSHLKDRENSKQAFKQALQLDDKDALISLNFSIFLFNNGDHKSASEQYNSYKSKLQHKNYENDSEVREASEKLCSALHLGSV